MQQTAVLKLRNCVVITTAGMFVLQPLPVPVFTYLTTVNSHASDRLKNLYFHANTYYYDTNFYDYMQLLK